MPIALFFRQRHYEALTRKLTRATTAKAESAVTGDGPPLCSEGALLLVWMETVVPVIVGRRLPLWAVVRPVQGTLLLLRVRGALLLMMALPVVAGGPATVSDDSGLRELGLDYQRRPRSMEGPACAMCLQVWGSFSSLDPHLGHEAMCEALAARDPALKSLVWRARWQWHSRPDRRLLSSVLELRAAESSRLSRSAVWSKHSRSFFRKGQVKKVTHPARPASPDLRGKVRRPHESAHILEWPCSACHAVMSATSRAQLTKQRDNHINRMHKGIPRSRFLTLTNQLGSNRDSVPSEAGPARTHHIKNVHPGLCNSMFRILEGRQSLYEDGSMRELLDNPEKRKAFHDDRRTKAIRDGVEPYPS
ncbi:rbcL [Symbiodinium sp. CCMP2592]|nr:rbcL [Symbiodinium sp. CCMP2592]